MMASNSTIPVEKTILTTATSLEILRARCLEDPSDPAARSLHALRCAREGLGQDACPFAPSGDEALAARASWLSTYNRARLELLRPVVNHGGMLDPDFERRFSGGSDPLQGDYYWNKD